MRRNTIASALRPDLGLVLHLDEEAREALFNVLVRYRVYDEACGMLCQSIAIGRPSAIPEHIERAFGPEASGVARAVRSCIENPVAGGMHAVGISDDELAMLKAPDWYIVALLDQAFEAVKHVLAYEYAGQSIEAPLEQIRDELNQVLRGAGARYTIGAEYATTSTEDNLLREEVLKPALAALEHPALSKVDADLQSGLQALRRGDRPGHETAILQAAAAVEGALAVLVSARRLQVKRQGAVHYFEALKDAGVVANHFRSLIMAPAEIRNKEAGHSSQVTPRSADADSARAAIYSACVAIAYLSSKLPPAAPRASRKLRWR